MNQEICSKKDCYEEWYLTCEDKKLCKKCWEKHCDAQEKKLQRSIR